MDLTLWLVIRADCGSKIYLHILAFYFFLLRLNKLELSIYGQTLTYAITTILQCFDVLRNIPYENGLTNFLGNTVSNNLVNCFGEMPRFL